MSESPIAIIACGGLLALECIEQMRAANPRTVVIALAGESRPEVVDRADHVLKWGQVGQLVKALERSGARRVLLIGSISQRPDFRAVAGDLETLKWLPRLVTTMSGGDDNVLRKVIGFFESSGYRIVSVAEAAPNLLAAEGTLTRKAPGAADRRDIDLGLAVLDAIAPFDVGQAVVVGAGRVAAVEAAEGTDPMIERIAEIRRQRRVAWKERAGILVKATKSQQDLRVDLPVIGPETVERCAAAGMAGIAVEAGRVVIAARAVCIERADEHGLFIHACRVAR